MCVCVGYLPSVQQQIIHIFDLQLTTATNRRMFSAAPPAAVVDWKITGRDTCGFRANVRLASLARLELRSHIRRSENIPRFPPLASSRSPLWLLTDAQKSRTLSGLARNLFICRNLDL